MMLNLARAIKPWKEADTLSAHISLYGFWTETTFLTKSGDLGMVLSVAVPTTTCALQTPSPMRFDPPRA